MFRGAAKTAALLLVLILGFAFGLSAQDGAQDGFADETVIPPPSQRPLVNRDLKGELLVAIETYDHAGATAALNLGANVGINLGEPSVLATAALLDDLRMVLILLKAGADPNATLDSPLAEAIRSDNREMVDLFFQLNAAVPGQVDAVELFESAQGGKNAEWFYTELIDRGLEPQLGLRSAVVHRRGALVKVCLDRGAKFQSLPPGSELLRSVAADELPEILRDMLPVAPRAEVEDYFFNVATSTGDRLLVDALVEQGAEVRLEHLEASMVHGQEELTEHLLDVLGGASVVVENPELEGYPLAFASLKEANAAQTQDLIRSSLVFLIPAFIVAIGVPMMLRRSRRSPASFHRFVAQGNLSRVSNLIDQGADVNGLHEDQRPLHVAVSHGHLTVVRRLLSRGAKADRRAADELGFTPLHTAVASGRQEIAETLIKGGSAVDVRAANGQTPLYTAAGAGLRPVVAWLIEQGANLEAKVREGETLLMHAIAHRNVEAVSVLLAAGANPNPDVPSSPLHRVAISGQAGMTRLLIDHGADVNGADGNGATPLQIALHHHQTEVSEILRKAGARLT